MGQQDPVNQSHVAIALGVGLGLVALIILCLTAVIAFHRRGARRSDSGKDFADKLRKLDAVTPVRTLEEFWTKTKGPLTPAEESDELFNCAVCLDPVLRDQEIRSLKCLHIFHKECLEKWYLKNHYNCPLCHRPYYVPETQTNQDYGWMV